MISSLCCAFLVYGEHELRCHGRDVVMVDRYPFPSAKKRPRRQGRGQFSAVESEVYNVGKRIFIFACDSGLWGHQGRPRPAFTTGLVRAYLAELLAAVPPEKAVYTATTDGLLTEAALTELKDTGPLATMFAELRKLVTGHATTLDVRRLCRISGANCGRGCVQIDEVLVHEPLLPSGQRVCGSHLHLNPRFDIYKTIILE